MKKVVKWIVVALLVIGAVVFWMNRDGGDADAPNFRTAPVVKGDFVSKVQATGTLEPSELVDVGAQVTGEIKEFGTDTEGRRIDYGSEVKAGQLLARIDDTIVELNIQRAEASVEQAKAQILNSNASVEQAKASISQAKANKNKADRDLERAKKLGVGDALSQMSYDQYVTAAETTAANLESATAQLETAKAQQASAQAQLLSAQAQLKSELRNRDYTHISSPVDGTIVVRQVNVGQTVVSNMSASTLFLVARDLSKMQIWASVNEADIAKVHPGQLVRFTVDARPHEDYTGTVNKIRPNATMSSNVVTYIVEIDIDNPERKLLPYMSANADFIVQEVKDALLVPDAAFDFHPAPKMLDPQFAGKKPDAAPAEDGPVTLWRKTDEHHVAPVRVIRGDSDGTRSIVTLPEGETLEPGTELVTGIEIIIPEGAGMAGGPGANGGQGGNLFRPKMPERPKRGAGGVEAKPGQEVKRQNRGPHF
ncbi:MAG: efflux RND transporter periplasmic adaptor subunit [Akkermansia sp.]|nr:efflux RND transporter periplasmic adaptor subunit [Akkermansia sp.]